MTARVRPADDAAPRPGPVRPSLFRRLLTTPDGPRPTAPVIDRSHALVSELAERLDSVLGIAERLAASHDRERAVPDDRR